LLVITGRDRDISNNIQKIYSLFAGALKSKCRSLRVLCYAVYELMLLSIIYYSSRASHLHLVGVETDRVRRSKLENIRLVSYNYHLYPVPENK